MKKLNVVLSTLFEEDFVATDNKLEELGAYIVEERYDLLYHRYDIHARLTLKQLYKLRKFVKSQAVTITWIGA